MKLPPPAYGIAVLILVGCGAGPIDGETGSQAEIPKDVGDDQGDPWHCGELGLKCIGPLGIGECIDGQCGPRLGQQCWGPQFAPTCDDYCEAFDLSCASQACDGATVWGWTGPPDWADLMCSDNTKDTAISLTLGCDEPLEGSLTVFRCCCE